MDKIILNDISVYGYHGVLSQEKELGQIFLTDLEVELDLKKASSTDDLNFTVNYVFLSDIVKNIVKNESFNLIETLAEKIAAEVLKNPLIQKVKVRLKKPFIPSRDFSGQVSVEIFREKSQEKGG